MLKETTAASALSWFELEIWIDLVCRLVPNVLLTVLLHCPKYEGISTYKSVYEVSHLKMGRNRMILLESVYVHAHIQYNEEACNPMCMNVCVRSDEWAGTDPCIAIIRPGPRSPDGPAPGCHGGEQWCCGCSDPGGLCCGPAGQSEQWTLCMSDTATGKVIYADKVILVME